MRTVKIDEQEVRNVGYTLAGYYAAMLEGRYDSNAFDDFGADSIHNCYEYIEIVDDIVIPYDEENRVDTEEYRDRIYRAIYDRYIDRSEMEGWR